MARVHGSNCRAAICLECGWQHARKGEFCSVRCRTDFNNRRKARGAELYDLFMVLRFDRPLAKLLGVYQLVCRMASVFREEDRAKREGRRSWRRPQAVIEERPYLKTIRGRA